MPAIATYEEIRDYPFFDECAEESWSDTDSYFNQVAESRQDYHHPPHTLKVRSREASRVLLFPPQKAYASYSLEKEFQALAKVWIKETAHFSLERQQITNLSFLRIIAMGEKVLPLILTELGRRPMQGWFIALQAISGTDNVTSGATSFREAIECWVNWGKDNGYLK